MLRQNYINFTTYNPKYLWMVPKLSRNFKFGAWNDNAVILANQKQSRKFAHVYTQRGSLPIVDPRATGHIALNECVNNKRLK